MKMRNKSLAVSAKMIPYIPALRVHAGGIASAVLMVQLDFYFNLAEKFVTGFYKFLEPVPDKRDENGNVVKGHEKYREGDSWCECMSCTPDEFRTIFDKIGIRYNSIKAFRAAELSGDPFRGKFYLSYIDRRSNLTWYRRDHEKVDAILDKIMYGKDVTPAKYSTCKMPATVNGKSQLQTCEKSAIETGVCPSPYYTDTTPEITSETTTTALAESAVSVVVNEYIFPPTITKDEQADILKMLTTIGIPQGSWQVLLDELHGAMLAKKIENSIGYLRGMAQRMANPSINGIFTQERSVKVAKQRDKLMAEKKTPSTSEQITQCTPEKLAKLPRRMSEFIRANAPMSKRPL